MSNNLDGWRERFAEKFSIADKFKIIGVLFPEKIYTNETIQFIKDLRKHDEEMLIKGLEENWDDNYWLGDVTKLIKDIYNK